MALLAAAVLCLFVVAPTSADAAVTVGSDMTLSPDAWNGGTVITQNRNLDVTGSTYSGFAVSGVLTSISVKTQGDAAQINVHLLRTSGAPGFQTQSFLNFSSIVSVAVPAIADTQGALTTVQTRIPVQIGDRFGIAGPGLGTRYTHLPVGLVDSDYCYYRSGSHAPQAVVSYSSNLCNNFIPLVSGTVEPDADRDGYGDETQDKCPTDGTRFDRECATANLVVTIAKVKRMAKKRAVITYRIANTGELPTEKVAFTSKLSRKLKSQKITRGCKPKSNRRSCTIASIAPGEVITIRVDVIGKRATGVDLAATAYGYTRESSRADNVALTRIRLRR